MNKSVLLSSAINNEDHFPSLSGESSIRKNVPGVKLVTMDNVRTIGASYMDTRDEMSELEKKKQYICLSVYEKRTCGYGRKCSYIHYLDEYPKTECKFGARCKLVKKVTDGYKNSGGDTTGYRSSSRVPVCRFLHPDETVENVVYRLGINPEVMIRPKLVFTRLCKFVLLDQPCDKPEGECTFAHKMDQLKLRSCSFGNRCFNIRKEGDNYINASEKICYFQHEDESVENYYDRVSSVERDRYVKEKPVEA